jgi:hypothetical protein
MNQSFAPVLFFGFNRPCHTQKTLQALSENLYAIETDLIVHLDGPRNSEDEIECREVERTVLKFKSKFKSLVVIKKTGNLGLAKSIIEGVSQAFLSHESVIVLEDDLVTSPYFLKFMNIGLTNYRENQEVGSIHGYLYPGIQLNENPFFLKGADCWGWATWSSRWKFFEPDGMALLSSLESKKLDFEFDLDGAYPFTQMLRDQIDGKNDSWAIRWHASLFLNSLITLYPGIPLVANIGFDGSGTHTGQSTIYEVILSNIEPISRKVPARISYESREKLKVFFSNAYFDGRPVITGIKTKLRICLSKVSQHSLKW